MVCVSALESGWRGRSEEGYLEPNAALERGHAIVVVHEDVDQCVERHAQRGKEEARVHPAPRHQDDDCMVIPVQENDLVLFESEDDRIEQLVKLAQVVDVQRVHHGVGHLRALRRAKEGIKAIRTTDRGGVHRDLEEHGQ